MYCTVGEKESNITALDGQTYPSPRVQDFARPQLGKPRCGRAKSWTLGLGYVCPSSAVMIDSISLKSETTFPQACKFCV